MHTRIYEAIRRRSSTAAGDAMRAHLDETLRQVKARTR